MESETPKGEENKNEGGGKTTNPKSNGYWTYPRIATVFAIIEGISVIVLEKASDFPPQANYLIRWFAFGGMLAGIAFGAHKLARGKLSGSIIWIIAAILWVTLLVSKSSQSTAFKIIPRKIYIETKTPRHFLMWNINGRFILSPINVIMLAQFTNLREKAMSINSYQFEGRTTNGSWETMPTIDTKFGSVISFYGTNWGTNGFGIIFGPAKEGDVCDANFGDDVFPKMLTESTMSVGASMDGYFFLEQPKHGFDGTMRCRIRDAADEEFLELVSPLNEKQLDTSLPKNHSGLGRLHDGASPSSNEIKKMPVVPYSKEWDSSPAVTQKTNDPAKINPALFVPWTVLGFGVLWTCFGWIFFQKRRD